MSDRDDLLTVDVAGTPVRVTHPDKVMYPSTGTTKRDVIDYVCAVGPWFTAHAHDRPAARRRWVDGVGTARDPGESFFERDLRTGIGDMPTRDFTHRTRTVTYPLVNDTATLVRLSQSDALEIHTPQWRYGPRGGIHNPDRAVFDLDPGDGAGLDECSAVAHFIREELDRQGTVTVPVTTGSRGIHVYAGLSGRHRPSVIRDGVHALADRLAEEHPDLVVSAQSADRAGKVLIDWSQNDGVRTTCAPYSLRGRLRPTVAAPRHWEEIGDGLRQLEYRQVLDRLLTDGDPMDVLLTPDDGGPSFVIQEHDASHLHWDFRLEHDGVLVSWALPKGMPTDTRHNRLAVRTPDHPLSYGRFEGTIGEGKAGAGTVRIWDAGTYRLETWHDDGISVTLRGRDAGGLGGAPVAVTLIAAALDGDPGNWLLHRRRNG